MVNAFSTHVLIWNIESHFKKGEEGRIMEGMNQTGV
jgi:hypothetical protein